MKFEIVLTSNNKIVETSSYPSCPRHAHHTVIVRGRLRSYLQYNARLTLMPAITAEGGHICQR